MLERLIATAVAAAMTVFSMTRYRVLNRSFDRTRAALPSQTSFATVYKILVAIALSIALASYWNSAPTLLKLYDSDLLRLLGAVVSVAGIFGFEASVWALGEQYSPCFDLRRPTHRVMTGPYRWLSHPMYVSNVTILIGVLISSGSVWILVATAIVTGYYVRSARTETRAMAHLRT